MNTILVKRYRDNPAKLTEWKAAQRIAACALEASRALHATASRGVGLRHTAAAHQQLVSETLAAEQADD